MDKFILGIDLGTSGPKVALFTAAGETVGYEFESNRLILLEGGGAEQDPEEWWQSVVRATRRLLARGRAPVDDIAAVSCTTQWSGTVAVGRDGQALTNAIIWMDSRGAPYVRQVVGGGIEVEGYNLRKLLTWMRKTGGVPGHAGKDSIAHILWLKHERPEIYRAAYKFLEPMDYLNLRLTGQFAASQATMLLHWVTDNRRIDHITYDPELLRLATIDGDKLPELRGCIDTVGSLTANAAKELGLPEGVRVVVGTSDVHSAAIGSGAIPDFAANLYLGTSSWLTCHVPYKKTDISHNIASLPSGVPGKYLLTNEQECAGVCLNYLRDNILYYPDMLVASEKAANVYQAFDRIVERTPAGQDRVMFLPWLYGERAPVDDSTVRGGFYNLSLKTTRDQAVRAVFEGVAYNTRWLLGAVEGFIGRKLDGVNMAGGGANSGVWCQVHADVLNRPVRKVKEPILANARGAALLAAVALGYMSFEDVPARIQFDRTYTPDPSCREYYAEMFRQFVSIYGANRKIYRALNTAPVK